MKAFKKRYKSSHPASPPPARRRSGPLIVAAAVLLIAAGALLAWGKSGREPGAPIEVSGAPRVAVAQDRVDHGDVKLGATISSVFQVSNVGDKPLQILGEPQVELAEGC